MIIDSNVIGEPTGFFLIPTNFPRLAMLRSFHQTANMMQEFDENGWAHIHQATFRGYIKSIERFVESDHEQLELETQDDLHSTPLLLAITSGSVQTVDCLLKLGAKIDTINSQNHGAVEISALHQFISLLQYFIDKNHEKLPVWKNLIKLLSSDIENEVENAGRCLRTLTNPSSEGVNPNWQNITSNGGIPVIVKVAKNSVNEESKFPAFQTLINILDVDDVQELLVSSGGIPAFIKLLKSQNSYAVQLAAEILKHLARKPDYAEIESQNQVIPCLLKVMQSFHDPEVLVQAVEAMGNIAEAGPHHQRAIGSAQGCIATIVTLFEKNYPLLSHTLVDAVSKIVKGDKDNQITFVDEGVTIQIMQVIMSQSRNRELQLSAVQAIHCLAEDNTHTQKDILDKGAERLLMQLLKKSRAEKLQENTALALWALAGDDLEEQREMANGIGVGMLIEFLNTVSENLHFIASEALGVLAQGPVNQQTQISQANGIHPLVRQLKSNKDYIGLSVIRTLRYLCVAVGNVPHHKNQMTISSSQGVKYLVALMVHSANEMIRVEAAVTLGHVSMGNKVILNEIHRYPDFSCVRILRMMYSQDNTVRLLAGSALAAFAYNNVMQQKEIAEQGGVRFASFIPFLMSDDEYFRCEAAYQIVILARIIPDEEQAKSSAAGIKLIVDLLENSTSDTILMLACDCIARLAHTRAGVPAAILAINAVDHLCRLLLSKAEQVRGCAAIALGYLSYNHRGERELLNKCRSDPYLMQEIKYFTKHHKLSPAFIEGWLHYKRVGLPAIPEGRTSLIRVKPDKDDSRPMTILSFDGTGNGSNIRSSASNLIGEDGQILTSRSRSSQMSNHAPSLNNSHLSA
ncbi:ankyrin and armadillo repeat-containing protein-like [Gigantopelta aegis]|uniref:ankyrin and armadillo repeat-containing protein-like n=1 Tax=Gigantopelta aegis TaxID=1735272 RepID=UPI001B88D3A9|nr:ankyrin and armadillo repeat-containing protein-like [Gigantopelta aegis]